MRVNSVLGRKGTAHRLSRLSEEQVLEIRRLAAESTITQREIAKRYHVSPSVISQIVTRKMWTHI